MSKGLTSNEDTFHIFSVKVPAITQEADISAQEFPDLVEVCRYRDVFVSFSQSFNLLDVGNKGFHLVKSLCCSPKYWSLLLLRVYILCCALYVSSSLFVVVVHVFPRMQVLNDQGAFTTWSASPTFLPSL